MNNNRKAQITKTTTITKGNAPQNSKNTNIQNKVICMDAQTPKTS